MEDDNGTKLHKNGASQRTIFCLFELLKQVQMTHSYFRINTSSIIPYSFASSPVIQ